MSDKIALSTWPTPLERVPRLAAALGLGADDLWIKRDDLIGLGGGGNKVRKLEWTVGAALASGADTLVTTGTTFPEGSFLWIVNNIQFQYFSILITLISAVVMVAVSYATAAPDYGEQCDEILTELGYGAAEIEGFRRSGAV